MKTFLGLILIAAIPLGAIADAGPSETILKSVEYVGTISGKTRDASDKVCKLVISQVEFTNQDYPDGPIKFQHVDYRIYTGADESTIAKKAVWDAEVISRSNVKNQLTSSDVSAIPMSIGTLGESSSSSSSFDGKILYKKEKRSDALYSGNTEIWISNVSAMVFDQKPTSVRLSMKGGTLFPTNTEADFNCQF